MLQQRRIEILYYKFPEIFRGIILEKYRYFSGKILEKFRGNFRTHNPSHKDQTEEMSSGSFCI